MRILILLSITGCRESKFEPAWANEQAPETFSARFVTTKGDFEIEVGRERSPMAADRLYQLIKHGYYDDAQFYRVVSGFAAQFGNTDTLAMNNWKAIKIPDEPMRYPNKKGTVAFARYGKESRGLEVFINLADNTTLDTITIDGVKGFPAFGSVTKGMDIVEKLYSGYGENPMTDPNLYLDPKQFYKSHPKLDFIKEAYLIDD